MTFFSFPSYFRTIPFQTHLKSATNNVTTHAAAQPVPQTSEASSSTQQASVSNTPQQQPPSAQNQEVSDNDMMARPGPSNVRKNKGLIVTRCAAVPKAPLCSTTALSTHMFNNSTIHSFVDLLICSSVCLSVFSIVCLFVIFSLVP